MKILITGAHGMLGKDLVDLFSKAGHEIIATDRNELDITDEAQVQEVVRKHSPNVIINAAAYNFVDKIEEEEIYPIAFGVNALGPKHLAQVAKDLGIRFIHFSTDYVFPGEKPEGYTEADERNPISKYGETKAQGEAFVEEVGGHYYIFRLSKIFGAPGLSQESKESFVALMIRLASEKPELNIVHEEVGSPSYTKDIAERVFTIIDEAELEPGVYHLINDGEGVTWYDFAKEIFALHPVNIPIQPVSSAEFPKPAQRPKFAALKSTKIPPLRSREEALKAFIATL